MGLWILATVVALLMLGVVVVALLYGRPDELVRPTVPDWTLPSPRDLAEPRFPLAWRGYDPDHVDAWVEGVRRARAELWAVLGPDGVAELQERLAAARTTGPVDGGPVRSDWHVPVGAREVPGPSTEASPTPPAGGSRQDEPLFTDDAGPEPSTGVRADGDPEPGDGRPSERDA